MNKKFYAGVQKENQTNQNKYPVLDTFLAGKQLSKLKKYRILKVYI